MQKITRTKKQNKRATQFSNKKCLIPERCDAEKKKKKERSSFSQHCTFLKIETEVETKKQLTSLLV